MARSGDGKGDSEERVRRGAVRTLSSATIVLGSLAVIGGWLYTGFYELALGEEAIILRLGKHHRTVEREGLNWHWPAPLEYATPVNTKGLRREEFAMTQSKPDESSGVARDEGLYIQTADNNIVNVSFELQYTVDDPYSFVYGMARPRAILKEAAQAAVREVIGRSVIEDVLTQRRRAIEVEAHEILDATLGEYFENRGAEQAFAIEKVNFQTVHPPALVRAAFEDVVAAQQDSERERSKANGDSREILEKAGAEAVELRERSEAYREAMIVESRGEAIRFEALLAEYQRAPEVTRRRLYLETMEQILPKAEKMIVEPNAVSVMPFVPSRTPALPGVAAGSQQ